MKLSYRCLFFIIVFLIGQTAKSQSNNVLLESWNKQVKPLGENYLSFKFSEKRSELENTFSPWQAIPYRGNGDVWCNAKNFLKRDSILTGHKVHAASVQFNSTDLLWQDYDARKLSPVTQKMKLSYLLQTARFTPIMLLDYFMQQHISKSTESNQFYALYKTTIQQHVVSLYIRNSDHIMYMVTILEHDDLYGDASTTISYDQYVNANGLDYPTTIKISKLNGRMNDEVMIRDAGMLPSVENLLIQPQQYSYVDEVKSQPEVVVEKYSDHIQFLSLKHTKNKVMLVEFSNFLVIVDAPLNTVNGELIIQEAKKIAAGKQIKYFSFGHHHPEYIGGVRAFVHEGARIITVPANYEYTKWVVNNPHTLSSDILQREPKTLLIDSMTNNGEVISDGKFEMKIFVLGVKSHHTGDYLIYYFPSQKLLFQDDLIQMKETGGMIKADAKQLALYNAIKELKLDVVQIAQSFQAGKDFKTLITFDELEKSTK